MIWHKHPFCITKSMVEIAIPNQSVDRAELQMHSREHHFLKRWNSSTHIKVVSVHEITATFWPRFSFHRNDQSEYVWTSRPAPEAELRGGSCSDSQIAWRGHICITLLGCMRLSSKTLREGHAEVGTWARKYWQDWGLGWGWGMVGRCWGRNWHTLEYVTIP